tara:strand:- start:3011 stop:3178 length:168 start_codon:yes stop_codon:yes gene_type:complete
MIIESGRFELRINKNNGTPEVEIYEEGMPYFKRNHKSSDYYSKKFVSLAKKESKK